MWSTSASPASNLPGVTTFRASDLSVLGFTPVPGPLFCCDVYLGTGAVVCGGPAAAVHVVDGINRRVVSSQSVAHTVASIAFHQPSGAIFAGDRRQGEIIRLAPVSVEQLKQRWYGPASGSAGRSSGRPSAAKRFCPMRTDATSDQRRTRARQGRQVPRAARVHDRQHGRVSVDLCVVCSDDSVCDAARGPIHNTCHLLRGASGVHQHRAGRCLPRRRPARGDLCR